MTQVGEREERPGVTVPVEVFEGIWNLILVDEGHERIEWRSKDVAFAAGSPSDDRVHVRIQCDIRPGFGGRSATTL